MLERFDVACALGLHSVQKVGGETQTGCEVTASAAQFGIVYEVGAGVLRYATVVQHPRSKRTRAPTAPRGATAHTRCYAIGDAMDGDRERAHVGLVQPTRHDALHQGAQVYMDMIAPDKSILNVRLILVRRLVPRVNEALATRSHVDLRERRGERLA